MNAKVQNILLICNYFAINLVVAQKQRGACRVHGGGFAGVIMAMLPNDLVEEYTKYMEKCLGEGCAYNMSIRPYGAICVSDYL